MKIRLVIKEDVGRIEERTLQVNYLIPFKSCYKGFPVIKYTYVPCLKVTMLCLFLLLFDCFKVSLCNNVFRTLSNI